MRKILVLLFCCLAFGIFGNNTNIEKAIYKLLDENDLDIHIEGIKELEAIGGDVVYDIYEAYRIGNLFVWEDRY